MNFSNLLQLAVTRFTSHSHETRRLALYNEATAFRQMKNFAEPLQTLFVTPAASIRELCSLYKLTRW